MHFVLWHTVSQDIFVYENIHEINFLANKFSWVPGTHKNILAQIKNLWFTLPNYHSAIPSYFVAVFHSPLMFLNLMV